MSGLLLAAVLAAACGRTPPSGPRAVAHRMIAEPTEETYDLRELRRSYGYQRRTFRNAQQLDLWRTHDEAEIALENRMMKIRPSGRGDDYIRLSHEIELSAEDVREIVVRAGGVTRDRLRLFWAIPGEGFAPERQLDVLASAASPVGSSGLADFRFDVAGHAAWRGRVRALRLDLPNLAGQEIGLRWVDFLGREDYQAEMLARIVAQDWKVELDHEARDAVVTPPDVPWSWRLPQAAGGRLAFAYGLPRGRGPEVRFSISVAGASEPLFEAAVDPRDESRAGRWIEAHVELPDDVAELVFETSAPANYRLEAGLPAWAHPEILTPRRDAPRPNVILISVDTLRADRLGVYGYAEPTSPEIDRWARSRAVTFRRAVAAAPWTLPSHVSMFSGLDALSHGVNHHLPAPRALELLPERLRRAGYLTAAVTGGGWLHPDQGLAQGFDIFRYWGHGTAGEKELASGIEHALKLLEAGRDRELFLFFHTYEAHDPFRRRSPWAERCPPAPEGEEEMLYGAVEKGRNRDDGFPLRYKFRKWSPDSTVRHSAPVTDDELPLVSCLYDSGVAYVDRQLGRLFERLEALDPERRTVVVLTSDHGESLGEHGDVKHAYLLDTNLLVPLIVGLPGGRHGGAVVDAQVASVDIVPTILDAVGLEVPAGLDGASLLPLIEGGSDAGSRQAWSYAGSSNFGLSLRLDDRLKYVFNNTAWPPLAGAEELYDLSADAEERDDLAPASPERVERLRARAREYLESRAQGVRVELEHGGCGELRGELDGLPIHVARVKVSRSSNRHLEWITKRRGGFRLRPGDSLDLLLESARGTLTVEGEVEPCGDSRATAGAVGFRHTLDLDRLDLWRIGFDGVAWREDAAGDGVTSRVALRRVGREVTEPEPAEMDPALVERLKALGYLDD